jgi:hypothetical protein
MSSLLQVDLLGARPARRLPPGDSEEGVSGVESGVAVIVWY